MSINIKNTANITTTNNTKNTNNTISIVQNTTQHSTLQPSTTYVENNPQDINYSLIILLGFAIFILTYFCLGIKKSKTQQAKSEEVKKESKNENESSNRSYNKQRHRNPQPQFNDYY